MSELPITDEDILKYAKTNSSAMRFIKEAKEKELWRLEKEMEKRESMKHDDEIAKAFIGVTIKDSQILEYRQGSYSDYCATVVQLITDKGIFTVDDPKYDSSEQSITGEEK